MNFNRRRAVTLSLVISMLLAIVFVGFNVNLTPVSAMTTTLYIDPTPAFASPCETFVVDVNVADVQDLYTWQFNITFDPDLLECLSVTEGPFLQNVGPTIFAGPIIDNAAGWVVAGCTLFMGPGANGSGTLAHIEFHCDGLGISPLHFEPSPETDLMDSTFAQIPHAAIDGSVIQTEYVEPIYLHGPPLTPIHMHSNESLVPVHMNSNMTLTPVHMHYIGDPLIDPIYEPVCTLWHELYPEFCQQWHLSSFEDHNGDGILNPNDQIDMTNLETGNVTWYHVDRITWTMNVTNEFGEEWMFIEFKGPLGADPINFPICTYWHEVYPIYSNVFHIVDATGPLENCTWILLEEIVHGMPTGNITMWHVEEVVTDLILREKIMDPICTWWHEIHPNYCEWWHLSSWEDNQPKNETGYNQLSPSDQIDMCSRIITQEEWDTFWHMGDVNRDGYIDDIDVQRIEAAYGQTGPPGWIPEDIVTDGVINLYDMVICTSNYGKDIWTHFGVEKEWYHVDRVTLTLNVSRELEPTEWMKIELKTYFFEEMYEALKYPVQTRWHEVYPNYSNVYTLTWWDWLYDDNCNGVLDVCDYIWLMNEKSGIEERYHVDDICYDLILNKKIMDPRCTYWHELYPDYCEEWHLTSWEESPEDPYPHRLSPCDQIDMTNLETGNVTWYHVDRVTLTMFITINATGEPYYFEFKGPFEDMYLAKTKPVCTNWTMVWPYYLGESGLHIEDWTDNCNGVLDHCDYILLSGVWCHVEELAVDIILNEKIADPVCTDWHELYPEFCNWYHVEGWTDNGDNLLSPCDSVDLAFLPTGPTEKYHVETVTLTINVTILGEPDIFYYFEYMGPFEDMYRAKTHPVCTDWMMVGGEHGMILHLEDWTDNCNGVLDYCDLVNLGGTWCHVEEVSIDMTVKKLVHDVAVTAVASLYPWVYQGQVDPISVTIANLGDYDEPTVDVFAFYDGTLAAPKQTTSLSKGEAKTLTFMWDTTGVPPGFYTVSANATIPIDDFPANNYLVGNVQEVRELLAPPEDLELYPRHVEILGDPTCTQWHELHPSKSNYYHLSSWEPGNILSQHDTIDMYLIEPPEKIYVFTDFVDPSVPICSEWFEEFPTPQWWHLSSWEDNNGDGFLSPCDQIDMTNLDTGEVVWFHVQFIDPPTPEPGPRMMHLDVKYWFQVDEVTVDMRLTPVEGGPQIFVDYKCGYWTFDPANPICTKWNEIDPVLGPIRCLHLSSWEDINLDGKLSPSDIIDMTITYPYSGAGSVIWYHVDFISISLLLTPYPSPPVVPPPPVGPVYLESEISYDKFDLANPVCTTWHEIYPVYSRIWHLSSWEDAIALSPSDHIVLTLKDQFHEPIPGTEAEYHVDKVTVAMNLTSTMEPFDTHIVKFEGSLKQFVIYHWEAPVSTQWHEVNPVYCRQWHIIEWIDTDLSGRLDYCDLVLMIDKATGWIEEFHVESLSTDIYVSSPLEHDVAVTNITIPKYIVGQGLCTRINVTTINEGEITETFNVTVCADTTVIHRFTGITLASGDSTTLSFCWDTTSFAKGNYTMSANATILDGEIDTLDNTLIDDWIIVTIPGDVDGDFDVDIYDIVSICVGYGSKKGDPNYFPNCDIDCDGDIDIYDVVTACTNYGKKHP
jgi:hypothetical protein